MALSDAERMRNMRARRAASIEAGPELRDASELLSPMVESTILALDLGPEHLGQAQLARNLARTIDTSKDRAWALRWLSPHLQAALQQLRATPLSRPEAKPVTPPPLTGLLLLRERSARDAEGQEAAEQEQAAVASRLLADGMDEEKIAAIMGVDERIVGYWLAMTGQDAEPAGEPASEGEDHDAGRD